MSVMNRRRGAFALLLVLLCGCSAHPKRVDCDGHLRPINAPAPVSATETGHP